MVVAITSDHHCGSVLGLCPPEGVHLDEGSTYLPSPAQRWLWNCWEDYWQQVAQHDADLIVILNGDLFEGAHHGTTQIISASPEPQAYVSSRVFGVPLGLHPTKLFIVRGTEAHVGPAGATEEAFARSIHAEQNPETKGWSWWHLRLELHGVRLDCQHHGRMGLRPWTEHAVVTYLAAQIFYEHARRGLPAPHFAIRSDKHRAGDSGDAHPVRVLQTPAWQLKTAHAHKVVPESISDVGGYLLTIHPNFETELKKIFYPVALPPLVRLP